MAEALHFGGLAGGDGGTDGGAEVGADGSINLRQLVEDYERRLILEALDRVGGNQRRAAMELGCLPTTLNEKMRRLGLRHCDRPLERPPGPPRVDTKSQ